MLIKSMVKFSFPYILFRHRLDEQVEFAIKMNSTAATYALIGNDPGSNLWPCLLEIEFNEVTSK